MERYIKSKVKTSKPKSVDDSEKKIKPDDFNQKATMGWSTFLWLLPKPVAVQGVVIKHRPITITFT